MYFVCFVLVLRLFYVSFVLVDCLLSSVVECARLFSRVTRFTHPLLATRAPMLFSARAELSHKVTKKFPYLQIFTHKNVTFLHFFFSWPLFGLPSIFPRTVLSQPISAPLSTRLRATPDPFLFHFRAIFEPLPNDNCNITVG